jgi:hypothetical protein
MIEHLKQNTEMLAHRTNLPAYQADVVFGTGESVVSVGAFTSDQKIPDLEGHSHTSVCKPTRTFDFPMRYVSEERKKAHGR